MSEMITLEKLFGIFQNGICVPRIQRGYVQGRVDEKGNEIEKYKKFAIDLVDAVFKKKELSLDFIYGVATNDDEAKRCLLPLDGQQRLSTLFLLAWLCRKWEKKWIFTYESRRIPHFFVKGLREHQREAEGKPSEEIENSGWFLPIWKEDPSVAGMLRMLDTLHEVIGERNRSNADFEQITFLLHGIDGRGDTFDHIFRKMNARGKELSPWENMKAMLDKHVPKVMKNEWRDKIDGDWAKCIWKHANKEIVSLDNAMEKIVRMAYVRFVSCCESAIPDNRVHRAVEAQKDSLWEMERTLDTNSEEVCKFFFQTTIDYFQSLKTLAGGGFTLAQCWTDNRTRNALWDQSSDETEFWNWLFKERFASAADLLRMALLSEKVHEGVEDDQRRRRILLNLLDATSIDKDNFSQALDAGLGFIAGKLDLEMDLKALKWYSPAQIEDEIRKCKINGNKIVDYEIDELVYKGSLRFIGWSDFENQVDIETRLNVIRNHIKGNEWLDFYQNLVSRIDLVKSDGRYAYTPLKQNDINTWRNMILTDGRFIDALKCWHDAPDNHPMPPVWMLHLTDLLNAKQVINSTLRCWDGRMFLLQTSRYRSAKSIRLDFNEKERNNRSRLKHNQVFYASPWPKIEAKESGIWYDVCDSAWWESDDPPRYIQDSQGFHLKPTPTEDQLDR